MEALEQFLSSVDVRDLDLSSPQSLAYVLMLLVALLYGMLLNQVYALYYRDNEPLDASLSRSLILLTPGLMTIFWLVQFSLPLSVGLLGALSFVRFRAPVKRAEDLAFVVITLACAISCAIVKPLIGGALISLFIIYSMVRNYLAPRSMQGADYAVLTFNTKVNPSMSDIDELFRLAECKAYEFVSSRTYDGITSFVFNIAHLKKAHIHTLTSHLNTLDQAASVNVFFPNGRLGT
jgi:hypothetical protein